MGRERIDVVAEVMEAWGRHDIDTVLANVTEDVEWHYLVGARPVRGREHMRNLLQRLTAVQRDATWRVTNHAETERGLLVEGVDDFTGPDGNRVRVPYMGAYEFEGDLISGWRDYVDEGMMARAMAGEQLGKWIDELIAAGSRPATPATQPTETG